MREQQRRVMVNGIDQPVVPIGLALRQVFRPAPSTGIDDEQPLRGDLPQRDHDTFLKRPPSFTVQGFRFVQDLQGELIGGDRCQSSREQYPIRHETVCTFGALIPVLAGTDWMHVQDDA